MTKQCENKWERWLQNEKWENWRLNGERENRKYDKDRGREGQKDRETYRQSDGMSLIDSGRNERIRKKKRKKVHNEKEKREDEKEWERWEWMRDIEKC